MAPNKAEVLEQYRLQAHGQRTAKVTTLGDLFDKLEEEKFPDPVVNELESALQVLQREGVWDGSSPLDEALVRWLERR